MKKIFTLITALVAFAGFASAASVDDIQPLKHSYVLNVNDYTNNGTGSRTKGTLFGDDHFLDVTGGSVATNKGSIDLSVVDTYGVVTEAIANKYGADYPGAALNSLRLKNAQDVIAFKATAGSKIIMFYQNNGKERYPKFCSDAACKNEISKGEITKCYDVEGVEKAYANLARIEWTVPSEADGVVTYVGSQGGDMFVSYIIVEANEAAGTPLIKVGAQTYENGRYFKTVSITPVDADGAATVVQYTTDGTTPTATNGTLYTAPFNVYGPATIKAVPFYSEVGEGLEVPGADGTGTADNEANVNFSFNAPTIADDGNGNVTISSEYAGAKNFVSYLDQTDVETNSITLTESSNVTAYSEISNGTYNNQNVTFESAKSTATVYVLSPIKEAKTIAIKNGSAEVDDENSTADATAYKFSDPSALAEKAYFFFDETPQVGIVSDAQYQVDGDSVYLKMSNNNNLSFKVAEGDSVTVTVVTSLNSCKNVTDLTKSYDKNLGDSIYTNLQNYVNVDGTSYGYQNTPDNFQNVITFGLNSGIHTFRKYSGTGNILVHSITVTPADASGIKNVNAAEATAVKPVKVIENGRLVIKSAKGTFTVDGARLK